MPMCSRGVHRTTGSIHVSRAGQRLRTQQVEPVEAVDHVETVRELGIDFIWQMPQRCSNTRRPSFCVSFSCLSALACCAPAASGNMPRQSKPAHRKCLTGRSPLADCIMSAHAKIDSNLISRSQYPLPDRYDANFYRLCITSVESESNKGSIRVKKFIGTNIKTKENFCNYVR